MRENSSTVLPVLDRLESTLSLLAIACVPGSEKSAPKAYRWATSRVSSVASSVRPTRMPTDPTPNSSGNANVSARASSIRAEPRPLADLTGGCAGNGGRLHDGRRRDGESQRRPIVQQRHHPRPGKTAGRNDYDIAAGVRTHTRHRRQAHRIVVSNGDAVAPNVIRAEAVEKSQGVSFRHSLDRRVLPHAGLGLAGNRVPDSLAHRELRHVLDEKRDRKIHHRKQDSQHRQQRQWPFHQHAAPSQGPLCTLGFAHFWLSYRPAAGIVEPAAPFSRQIIARHLAAVRL